MSIPRDHHFIPAFYLKQWCDRAGKLVEYTIKHGKLIPKVVGPDATGYEFDLYAFPELPKDQSQYVEQKFFDYADRAAADALRLHLSGYTGEWASELRSAWSRFVIALHMRHPDAMPELRAAANALWEGSGADSQREYERIKQPGDPDTFDEYIAKIDPHIPAKARMSIIMHTFDNEIVGDHVNKMNWAIIDVSTSNRLLLTSDRPVSLSKIKDVDGILGIPISPTKLFIAVNDARMIDRFRHMKDREIAGRANLEAVARARRFVWAADQSQETFIHKHMSTRLEPTPFFPQLAITKS
jgi:hypothetical protein